MNEVHPLGRKAVLLQRKGTEIEALHCHVTRVALIAPALAVSRLMDDYIVWIAPEDLQAVADLIGLTIREVDYEKEAA